MMRYWLSENKVLALSLVGMIAAFCVFMFAVDGCMSEIGETLKKEKQQIRQDCKDAGGKPIGDKCHFTFSK